MNRYASSLVVALACALWVSAAHAQTSPSDLLTRMDRMQETIRNLTGTVEQLQYHNQQLEQQVQRLQQEVEGGARTSSGPPPRQTAQIPPPSAVAPQAPAPMESPPSSGRDGDAFDPMRNPNAAGAPRQLGAPGVAAAEPPPVVSDASRQPGAPLDLSGSEGGTAPSGPLPPPPPRNPSSTGDMQATLPPSNSPRDEYDLGYGYILHKDYQLAANAFSAFLRKYPSDRMAPEAQYWMGEALFQTQRYRDAAEAFLTVSTKYETTARAPDALLRLGQSLAALGEKEAACASLGEVLRKYPRASLSVKQSVDREQKRAHC